MLQQILLFVINVVLVLITFSLILLTILWMIGKNKSDTLAHASQSRVAKARQSARRTPTQPHQQHHAAISASPYEPSPTFVAPRRLSFSSAITATPRTPQTMGQSTTPRRVTFSLTPEQQQNEYDKRATDNLQRHRPPMLSTTARPSMDTPLIELFPSAMQPTAAPVDDRKLSAGLSQAKPANAHFREHMPVHDAPGWREAPRTHFRSLRDAPPFSPFTQSRMATVLPTRPASRPPLPPTSHMPAHWQGGPTAAMVPNRVTIANVPQFGQPAADAGGRKRRPPPLAFVT